MPRVRLALASLLILAATAPVRAQTGLQAVVDTVSVDSLAKLVQDIGYRAEVTTGKDGKQRVKTRIGGWNVVLSPYSCEGNGECKSIGMTCFFTDAKDKDASFANDWNQKKRFAKVYIDQDKDVNFEYDIIFTGGVTKENIRAHFDVYEDQLKDFVEALRKK